MRFYHMYVFAIRFSSTVFWSSFYVRIYWMLINLLLLLFYSMNVLEFNFFLNMNFDCFSFLIQNSIALNIFVCTCVYFHEVDARRGVAELKDVCILNSGDVFRLSGCCVQTLTAWSSLNLLYVVYVWLFFFKNVFWPCFRLPEKRAKILRRIPVHHSCQCPKG